MIRVRNDACIVSRAPAASLALRLNCFSLLYLVNSLSTLLVHYSACTASQRHDRPKMKDSSPSVSRHCTATEDSDSDNDGDSDSHTNNANPRLDANVNGAPGSSRLEDLPPELRRQILSSVPDLPSLRSVIRASPVLHAQYRNDRDSILRACVARELHGFAVDACATLKSRARELGSPRTNDKIEHFLDSYKTWLSGSGPGPDPDSGQNQDESILESLPPGLVRWLAAFHLSVARPLALRFSEWALANLSAVAKNDDAETNRGPEETSRISDVHGGGNATSNLSRSEEIRIFRALYRYETYHHLFGQNQAPRHGDYRHHEVNDIFLCLFDPWEVDALACIDVFIRKMYNDIFDKVQDSLDHRNSRFRIDGAFHPDGSFDLKAERNGKYLTLPDITSQSSLTIYTVLIHISNTNHVTKLDYMDGTISRGLKMTIRLLSVATGDHEALVTKMQRCLTHDRCQDPPLSRALAAVAQDDRREMSDSFPNARDEAEERRDSLEFAGDHVPPDGPPLAWVLFWHGKYSNAYGGYIPRPLQEWGYVLWDSRRWAENLEAREQIGSILETDTELVDEILADRGWNPLDYEQPDLSTIENPQ